MASTVVDLNQHSNGSLASKSNRPHAPVDPVPANNLSGEENNEAPAKCNHFSIRGYVLEVRKRDPKLCYPFTLNDSTDPANELPPMVVPNFKWWQCTDCVPEAAKVLWKDSSGTGPEEAQNFENADAPTLAVGNSSKVSNGALIRSAEANTSTDSNDNRNCLQVSNVCPDRKGKGKVHVEYELPPCSGFKNGFSKEFSTQWVLPQSMNHIDVKHSVGTEVAFRSTYNGVRTPEALQKTYRVVRTEVGTSGYANHELGHATENHTGNFQASSGHQHAYSPANGVEVTIAGIVDEPHSHSESLQLPDLNKCSGDPSLQQNNGTIVTGNNINSLYEDDDDYLGAERRKKPKVRLLSELLGLKETQGPSKGKKKAFPSANSQDENVKWNKTGAQDERSKSLETRSLDDGSKKTVGPTDVSESETESDSDDVSTEKISEALAKRRCKPRDPLPEKRNKKLKVDRIESSSLSRQLIKPKSGDGKGKSTEDSPPKSDLFAQFRLRNPVVTKKRGRVLQPRKEPTSVMPSKTQILKDSGATQNNGEVVQPAADNIPISSENVYVFPSSSMDKESEQMYTPQGKDVFNRPACLAESMLVDGSRVQKHKENRNIAETLAIRTTADGSPSTGNQSDGERGMGPNTNPEEKKARIPEAEESSHLAQRMPMQVCNSVVNQREHANEVRGRIHDIDINSIPVDDKVNEQGMGDDIPMDIVELMAKNQYERHLEDPREKHNHPAQPSISCTYATQNGASSSYGHNVPTFMHSQFLSIQKPPSIDPRSSLFGGNMGHFGDLHRNSLGVQGLPRDKLVSARFLSPGQGHEHIRPYSEHALPSNNWNRNNVAAALQFPPSFLHAVEQYQKLSATAPRQSAAEVPGFWTTGMTSRMPLGITNPHMVSQSSNVMDRWKIHQQSSGSILNFNVAHATNLEKLQNLSFSSASICGKPESSSRPVDVNEAIPAMHLLSLMQNAGKVQNTELSLGPQKVVGATSSRQPFVRSSRVSAMQDYSAHPCYPTAIATGRSFGSSFQKDGGNVGRTSAGFTIPLTLGGRRNMETSHFAPPSGEHRPLKRSMAPPLDKGKVLASMSKPPYTKNSQLVMKDSSNMQYASGVRPDEKNPSLAPENVICQLSQNPSEFTDLKLLSQFMIGPEDFKPRKMVRDKAFRPRGDARKPGVRVNKPVPPVTDSEKQRRS